MATGHPAARNWGALMLQAVVVCLSITVWSVLTGEGGWRGSAISALVVAPFYAGVMYLGTRHQRVTDARIAEGLSAAQRRQVYRAATGGRVPCDPLVRAAAIAVLEARLADGARHRTLSLGVVALFAVLSVIFAITEGGWFILGTVLFAVVLVWLALDQRLLARRIARLQAAEGRTAYSAR